MPNPIPNIIEIVKVEREILKSPIKVKSMHGHYVFILLCVQYLRTIRNILEILYASNN